MGSEAKERTKSAIHYEVSGSQLRRVESGLAIGPLACTVAFFRSEKSAMEFGKWLADLRNCAAAADDSFPDLIDRADAADQRAEAAERERDEIKQRTTTAIDQFDKLAELIGAECNALGIEWRSTAETTLMAVLAKLRENAVQPGDVVYRRTGIEECVMFPDFINNGSGTPVYRRIDAPEPRRSSNAESEPTPSADEAGLNTAHVSGGVTSDETARRDGHSDVEYGGKRYRKEPEDDKGTSAELAKLRREVNELSLCIDTKSVLIVDVPKEAIARIRELEQENERLKRTEEYLQSRITELDLARKALLMLGQIHEAPWLLEALGATESFCLACGDVNGKHTEKCPTSQHAKPEAAEPSSSVPTGEAGERMWSVVTVSMGDDTIPALKLRDRFADRGMLQAAADWLNRRSQIESRLADAAKLRNEVNELSHAIGFHSGLLVDVPGRAIAQLAQLKQQAEAITKIRAELRDMIEISSSPFRWLTGQRKWFEGFCEAAKRVLALAAQLEASVVKESLTTQTDGDNQHAR